MWPVLFWPVHFCKKKWFLACPLLQKKNDFWPVLWPVLISGPLYYQNVKYKKCALTKWRPKRNTLVVSLTLYGLKGIFVDDVDGLINRSKLIIRWLKFWSKRDSFLACISRSLLIITYFKIAKSRVQNTLGWKFQLWNFGSEFLTQKWKSWSKSEFW